MGFAEDTYIFNDLEEFFQRMRVKKGKESDKSGNKKGGRA